MVKLGLSSDVFNIRVRVSVRLPEQYKATVCVGFPTQHHINADK